MQKEPLGNFHPRPASPPFGSAVLTKSSQSGGQSPLNYICFHIIKWKLSSARRAGVEIPLRFLFFLLISIFLTSCQNDPADNSNNSSTSTEITTPTEEKIIFQDPFLSSTDAFVKKYKGTIGEKPIELTLVNFENGLLEGHFFYTKNNLSTEKAGKKIDLSGELALDESFVLEIFDNDDYLGKFEGDLKNLNTIKGNWSNADSSLSETYKIVETPFDDQSGWTGAWYRNVEDNRGLLVIGNVSSHKFDFGLEVYNSGHNGIMEGTAVLNGRIGTFNATVFDDDETCNIIFQKKENHIMVMQKSSTVACGFGMRANADGKYEDRILE